MQKLVAVALAALSCVAHGAQQQTISVPGTSRPELLIVPGGKASAGAGTLPLLVFLRGLDCAFTPQQLAAIPGAAQVLANSFNVGAAKFGISDDIATLAANAADALGAVALVLTPPRSATSCTLCAASVKAAQAVAAGNPNREFTLAGAALLSNASASGIDCPAWDAGPVCCLSSSKSRGDVDFVLNAIDAATKKAPAANRNAVTVVGFSAGAFMANRLACDAPAGRVKSFLAYAGSEPGTACNPPEARAALIMQGKQDLQIPFGGAPAGSGVSYPGAEATLAGWARRNRCSGEPRRSVQGNIEVVSFAGCAAPTTGWFVNDWGHLPPKTAGPVFVDAIKQVISRG
jgi:polyhydroxybutyrate depolymerase